MAEDSLGKQVMDAISSPARKVSEFVDRVTGHASTAPPTPQSAKPDYSWHAQMVKQANDSYAKSQAGQAHGQTARRQRLTRKYQGQK